MAEQDRHKGAIDAVREEFLFLSINEMIAEFSEYQLADSSAGKTPRRAGRRGASDARVLCLPAHDRADEITASMLAQILEQKGSRLCPFPSSGLLSMKCSR
jgi:hypothetical protein